MRWTSASAMPQYLTAGHHEVESRHLDSTRFGTLTNKCSQIVLWTMFWILL